MLEPMATRVEVYPLAADDHHIYNLAREGPWSPGNPVWHDGDPHFDVERALTDHGIERPALLHSTSWRTDPTGCIHTYMAVVRVPAPIRLHGWADAIEITLGLFDAIGKPVWHQPDEPPMPTSLDVLFHGIRALRFLAETDGSAAILREEPWSTHLAAFQPALAGMYQHD